MIQKDFDPGKDKMSKSAESGITKKVEQCNHNNKTEKNLNKHMKLKHKSTIKCTMCEMKFSNENSLEDHIKEEHS